MINDRQIGDPNPLRIENELFDVLTVGERDNFDLDTALKRINNAMKSVL